jgi:hypothetical protein
MAMEESVVLDFAILLIAMAASAGTAGAEDGGNAVSACVFAAASPPASAVCTMGAALLSGGVNSADAPFSCGASAFASFATLFASADSPLASIGAECGGGFGGCGAGALSAGAASIGAAGDGADVSALLVGAVSVGAATI